jgi:hypothetical protein
MNQRLFVSALLFAVSFSPVAFADTITFNHDANSYTLVSDNPANQGTVIIDNAFIEDSSATQSLTITGLEYYFGGTGYTTGHTPATNSGTGWNYILGVGAYSNSAGTAWAAHNSIPTPGGAVKPATGAQTDYLATVSLIQGNAADPSLCYIGETLAVGASCDVELQVTANYGGVLGSSSVTKMWGYAEGLEGSTTVGSDMIENIDVDVAPEPSSLLLLATGLLGLGMIVRRKLSYN